MTDRNRALDGLRAVAVALVIAFHCDRNGVTGGFVGVDVFFVLSGFLITTLLMDECDQTGTIAVGRFYIRRAMRLWPALLMMLAAYVAAAPLLFPEADARWDALLAGLYLSDYSHAFWGVPDAINHTWSLSVEEHFYLLWPFAILALARIDRRVACYLLAAAFALATLWRITDLVIWHDFRWTYFRFDTRMSGLLLGSAIAMLPWRPATRPTAEALSVAGMLCLLWAAATLQWMTPEPLLLPGVIVDLGAGCVVMALASGQRSLLGRALSWWPIVYVGAISYSLYLWHYPIMKVLRDHFDATWVIALIAVPLSLAIAALSFEFVEKPIAAVRKQMTGARVSSREAG